MRHLRFAAVLGMGLAGQAWAGSADGAPGRGFDLQAYRLQAASDRGRGIEEGRRALREDVFKDAPRDRLRLLWYMGGAAIGKPDPDALSEVVRELVVMDAQGVPGAASLAGFLRGERHLDLGEVGQGLTTVLEAANAIPDDPELRLISAAALCRAYASAGLPGRGLEHCRRHTRLSQAASDPLQLARAQYLEAGVLSAVGDPEQAIPLWREAHQAFRQAGLEALAGRVAGSLASGLIDTGDHAGALELALDAVQAAHSTGNVISIAIAQGLQAEALIGLGRVDEGLAIIAEALARARGLDHPTSLQQLKRVQRQGLRAQGAPAAELARLDAEIAALDADEPEPVQAGQITDLEEQFLRREQELRIRELEQENRRKELDIEAARNRELAAEQRAREQGTYALLWGMAVLVLATIVVAAALVIRAQRRVARTLREQAYRDGLTLLPNRRALVERIQALIARGEQAGPHALLIIDLDHFKQVNDRHGHLAGDQALSAVAEVLSGLTPADGITGRLGGEEFVMLAPGHDRARAAGLAERIRAEVAALALPLEDGETLRVTVSIGVAFSSDFRPVEQAPWMSAADAALYRAKAAGRDRVELAPPR